MSEMLPEDWKIALEAPEPVCPSLQHFRTPVDGGYVAQVGQATYAYSYLEWQIVSIGQKIAPGFGYDMAKKAAGKIAVKLDDELAAFSGDVSLKADLQAVTQRLKTIVDRRNDLFHAHPATLKGQQRLQRWTPTRVFNWEPDDIVMFVHEIEELADEANTLFYDPRMPR